MNWLVFGVLRTGGLIPKGLAELATEEIEIVDRFGDWHDLIGLKAREHFWADGFAIDTPGRIFSTMHSSTCFTRWNAGIAQGTVSFNKGIALEGGERIPPFSEIHIFLPARVESGWLISPEDIVQQNYREGSAHSLDLSSSPRSKQSAVRAVSDER